MSTPIFTFFTDGWMSPGADPVAGRTVLYDMSSLPSRREGRDDPRDVDGWRAENFFHFAVDNEN